MPSRWRARISTRVWACTPSTAETTSTAPSRTPRTRSTSAMKSECPGVSIRLTVTSSIAKDTTADRIVIPRCFSSARVSVWVLPASTLPTSSMTPAPYSSRSVRVVLPASTCARIPKFNDFTSKHVLCIGEYLLTGHVCFAHVLLLGLLGLLSNGKHQCIKRRRRSQPIYARHCCGGADLSESGDPLHPPERHCAKQQRTGEHDSGLPPLQRPVVLGRLVRELLAVALVGEPVEAGLLLGGCLRLLGCAQPKAVGDPATAPWRPRCLCRRSRRRAARHPGARTRPPACRSAGRALDRIIPAGCRP